METSEDKLSTFNELISPNTEIVVTVPWNGKPIPVTIRMLDSVSLTSCGEFNTVSAYLDPSDAGLKEEYTFETLVNTKNIHENILKLALVSPTFEEITEILVDKDFYKDKIKKVEKLKKDINELESSEQKNKYAHEIELIDLSLAFLLPEDFTGAIVAIELQKEATDLNKLTRDTLLSAGFLGEKYNERPSSYIEGSFTEKNKTDIDITALVLVSEYREMASVEKNSKMHWIRGGKKNA